MLSLLLFCQLVAAQDYQIRADVNINLRDTYSLDGDVVEVVPAGSVLQVVGRFNRWLKIDRDGIDLWMADWVSFTRLTGTDQTQTRTGTGTRDSGQTQSEIDNCCFVDRQCSADADWVSGYWAFQNGQCPVPEQTRLQTPLQTTTTDTSQINNCCFIGWQCTSDEEWAHGYRAFQNRRCKHRGLEIEGPQNFVLRIEEAFDILQQRAPEWYTYSINGLDKIVLVPGDRNLATVYFATRVVEMTHSYAFGSLLGLAAGMAHEACHVYRYQDGTRSEVTVEEELACERVELEASKAIDPTGRLPARIQFNIDNIYNPEYQWWN